MIENNYYAASAYDSRKNLVNQRTESEQYQSFLEKSVTSYAVKGLGQHCREFIAIENMSDVEILKDDEAEEKDHPVHEVYTWYSLKNPRVIVKFITHMCMFFAVPSIFTTLYMGITDQFDRGLLDFFVIWVLIPFFIFFTGQYALKKNWIKDKNNTLLNRRTGLITFTWKGKRVSHPFHEFNVAIRHNVGRANVSYHLFLYHAETGHFCMEPGGQVEQWKAEQNWEVLQQYMDISQPLPDIPRMEFYRERDPVTAAWDKKHNRPKHYWRDKEFEAANKMHEQSVIAAKAFNWGETREQALQRGWNPSGMGDGDWQIKGTD